MIDATPGVEYFHVSTDEVYYAGICSKCPDEYTVENRSRIWVDYVNRVNRWMQARNRKVLCWVEYPLLVDDISLLPSGLIDAITVPGRDKKWINAEIDAGIHQIAYTSMQGSEFLFPNLFPTEYRGRQIQGRLPNARATVSTLRQNGVENLVGTFCASWDDSGLHDEVFWLGWAAVTQYGWTHGQPTIEQTVADFFDVYYGPGNADITDLYRLLEEGARYYESLWDRKVSVERTTGYGNSRGKGIGAERQDLFLKLPELPDASTLNVGGLFRERYTSKIESAKNLAPRIDVLAQKLTSKMTDGPRNRYNLEVLLSIAHLERFTLQTVLELARAEDHLLSASRLAQSDPVAATHQLMEAYDTAGQILEAQEWMWRNLISVWEKSRFPRNRSVGDRQFIWVMDDVKDHFADRRKGLEYMLAPFERMDLPGWRARLLERIREYAERNGLPVED
jgi:hypothetical protein